MYQAILFDADGVLVDACELHRQAFVQALQEFGWDMSREEHEYEYNALPTRTKLERLTTRRGLPLELHTPIHDAKQRFTGVLIESCLQPDPTKQQLLKALRDQGLRVAVCSNSLQSTLQTMLRATALLDWVEVVIGNDDVPSPKPAPDMYQLAADRLRVPIAKCVIVEDSPVGIAAAVAADPGKIVTVTGPHQVNLDLLSVLYPDLLPTLPLAA